MRYAYLLSTLLLLAPAGCVGGAVEPDDGGIPDLSAASDLQAGSTLDSDPEIADLRPASPIDDGGVVDSGTPLILTGTQLVAGASVSVLGICNGAGIDAIFIDNDTHTLEAVPIVGGAPKTIETTDYAYLVGVGPFVASFHNSDPTTGKAALSIWSRAGGRVQLADASYLKGGVPSQVVVTGDQQYVIYLDNLAPDGSVADVYVARTDGTQKHKITSTPVVLSPSACRPFYLPASSVPGNSDPAKTSFFVVGTCPAPGDAGALELDIDSVDPAAATPALTTIVHDANGALVNPAGSQLVVTDGAGHLQAAIATASSSFGPLHALDSSESATAFRLSSDGAKVLYLTQAGAILTASTSMTPAPKTLIASGAYSIISVSRDFHSFLFNRTKPSATRATDLFLAPIDAASTPATPTTISGTPTARVYFDGFTADSRSVVYLANWAGGAAGGTLTSIPVAGGTAKTYGAMSVGDFDLSGTKLQIADNLRKIGGRTVIDLRVADTSSNSPPPYVATAVDPATAYTFDATKLAYTIRGLPGTQSGLYLAPVP
jgi:hypothetical protein